MYVRSVCAAIVIVAVIAAVGHLRSPVPATQAASTPSWSLPAPDLLGRIDQLDLPHVSRRQALLRISAAAKVPLPPVSASELEDAPERAIVDCSFWNVRTVDAFEYSMQCDNGAMPSLVEYDRVVAIDISDLCPPPAQPAVPKAKPDDLENNTSISGIRADQQGMRLPALTEQERLTNTLCQPFSSGRGTDGGIQLPPLPGRIVLHVGVLSTRDLLANLDQVRHPCRLDGAQPPVGWQLDRRIGDFSADQERLIDVIDRLCRQTGASVTVLWRALPNPLDRDARVTVRLHDVTLHAALLKILVAGGATEDELRDRVSQLNSIVTVGAYGEYDALRAYDVRALLPHAIGWAATIKPARAGALTPEHALIRVITSQLAPFGLIQPGAGEDGNDGLQIYGGRLVWAREQSAQDELWRLLHTLATTGRLPEEPPAVPADP